jgi:YHS domain-containing protein
LQKDPVCGMMVDEKKAKFTTNREGKTIYFCSAACKTSFDMNPQSTFTHRTLSHPELMSRALILAMQFPADYILSNICRASFK